MWVKWVPRLDLNQSLTKICHFWGSWYSNSEVKGGLAIRNHKIWCGSLLVTLFSLDFLWFLIDDHFFTFQIFVVLLMTLFPLLSGPNCPEGPLSQDQTDPEGQFCPTYRPFGQVRSYFTGLSGQFGPVVLGLRASFTGPSGQFCPDLLAFRASLVLLYWSFGPVRSCCFEPSGSSVLFYWRFSDPYVTSNDLNSAENVPIRFPVEFPSQIYVTCDMSYINIRFLALSDP